MDQAHSSRFDLCERTALFGEAVIRSCRELRADPLSAPIIRQLVRAATSIGANYVEADEAGSRKEFKYRISVCKRETKETRIGFVCSLQQSLPIATNRQLSGKKLTSCCSS